MNIKSMSVRTLALGMVFGLAAPLWADAYDPPAGYYTGATGTGATLKSQLLTAMSTGHIQQTYGDFRYSAPYHDADPNNPGKILLVYNRASVSGAWDSGATWNREHTWPESRQPGTASNSSKGSLGDPHMLRPCNASINSSRGNKPYGYANTTGSYGHIDGTYYFPGDADKGDIARALFYTDTRWTASGLSLVNTVPSGFQMGNLDALVAWNYLDPPDTFERRRNHVIWGAEGNPYATHNRNAYIDNPWFVWSVYVDQANDSTVFVGDAPEADGSSQTVVVLDDALVGDASPLASVEIRRAGFDGTYFRVTPDGGAASPDEGPFNAFRVNATGLDAKTISVGLDASAMSTPGAKVALVTIDNLDITTGGGSGHGANDLDDSIMIVGAVFDHANASFDPSSDVDTLELDLGSIAQGSGDAMVVFDLYNITVGDPLYLAGLDVEPQSATGDTGALTTSLGVVAALPHAQVFVATLDDAFAGSFEATYTFRTFDDRASFTTAIEGDPITIHLVGVVTPAACAGDASGDGMVDVDDLNAVLAAWNTNVGVGSPIDLAGNDGFVGVDDLNAVLANWNTACP